jgi:hypothetical protein
MVRGLSLREALFAGMYLAFLLPFAPDRVENHGAEQQTAAVYIKLQ